MFGEANLWYVPKRSLYQTIMDVTHTGASAMYNSCAEALKQRTWLEIALGTTVAAGVGYMAYQASVPSKAKKVFTSVVPGYRWARAKFGKYEIVIPQSSSASLIMESRRVGSDEVPLTMPKVQCLIATRTGSEMHVIGCAVRFAGNYLVAPDHVLSSGSGIEKFAKGSQTWVSLGDLERIQLDADLCAIKLSDKQFAAIGVSVCKPRSLTGTTLAKIVGPDSKGTSGLLRHDPMAFGMVLYNGTTLPGYSGAVYTAGPSVYGIHQMGGKVNGGFSADYVHNMLLVATNQRLESSPEWLLGQFKAGVKMTWRPTGDPDTFQMRAGEQYVLVDQDDMDRVFGTKWKNFRDIEDVREVRHQDYESVAANFNNQESILGECNSSDSLGGSSSVKNSQDSVHLDALQLTLAYKKLSPQQRRNFRDCSGLSGSQPKVTFGPESKDSPQN